MSQYLNEFIKLKYAPELIRLKIFPNIKEITESMGCFHAIIQSLNQSMALNKPMNHCGRTDLTVLIVGDGHGPRTGALCASRSRWKVMSIDPLMQKKYLQGLNHKCFSNLTCFRDMAENLKIKIDQNLVIVFPHSHADILATIKNFNVDDRCLKTVIQLPCCYSVGIDGEDFSYADHKVIGEKNRFYIWNDFRMK